MDLYEMMTSIEINLCLKVRSATANRNRKKPAIAKRSTAAVMTISLSLDCVQIKRFNRRLLLDTLEDIHTLMQSSSQEIRYLPPRSSQQYITYHNGAAKYLLVGVRVQQIVHGVANRSVNSINDW